MYTNMKNITIMPKLNTGKLIKSSPLLLCKQIYKETFC